MHKTPVTLLTGSGESPVKLATAMVAARSPHPLLWHSGMTVRGFFLLHLMGAGLPVTAGLLLYGWRALVLMLVVIASTLLAMNIWRRVGPRGRQLRYSHGIWLALLLSLMLPVHFLTTEPPFENLPGALWAILPASGILIAASAWVLGGVGSSRIHPAVVSYLLLVVLFKQALVPHWVLQKDHLFKGDVTKSERSESVGSSGEAWVKLAAPPGMQGLWMRPASELLLEFTSAQKQPDRAFVKLEGLLRDDMPPLEDLIIGGQPGPIGASSAIAVIVGGLFLLYRGVIDFRIPLLIFLVAWIGFMVLPIPSAIEEMIIRGSHQTRAEWHWLSFRTSAVGVAKGITFANYETLAGPLLLTAFFLATSPAVRPMSRRGRVIYAVLIGGLSAVLQLYVSVAFGAYLALLIVSLLTPTFDKWFKPRPLV